MPLYEHIFMVRQDASNAQVDGLTQHFKTVIEEHGGSIGKVEYWGVKSLAFRIRKNRKAHYTLMNVNAPHPAVAEMERQMSLNEDVIRFLTIRVDDLEEGPSAMMRRGRDERGRDDRGREDRGPRERDDRGRRESRGPRRGEAEASEEVH
jgi:small subunit ribosomal protein S6